MNTQNSSGMMNGLPPLNKTDRKIGPIVGALVIVLILVIAALYFFGQKLNTDTANPVAAPASQEPQNAPATTSSDSAAAIEADLDAQFRDIDYSF